MPSNKESNRAPDPVVRHHVSLPPNPSIPSHAASGLSRNTKHSSENHLLPISTSRPMSSQRTSIVQTQLLVPLDAESLQSYQRSASADTGPEELINLPTEQQKALSSGDMVRWCGRTKSVREWDGLRRDTELWCERDNCSIYLHDNGTSRRGPSFRISAKLLERAGYTSLLQQCFVSPHLAGFRQSACTSATQGADRAARPVSLFIPAPEAASRAHSYRWHMTTRNFFAFLLNKPLAGEHLGQALVDLQERVELYRPASHNNAQEVLAYAENQGYRDLTDSPDHALATLFYAEHFHLRKLWIDAFAHCVGMNDRLVYSREFSTTPKPTKALIVRARRGMNLHLDHVFAALNTFLENDLSATYLGLTAEARIHLDRFRELLLSIYAEKLESWPRGRGAPFSKALYTSMHRDFQNLFDYLVDIGSTTDLTRQKPASGGICIVQNIISFDKRHHFKARAHPLPLLPSDNSPTRCPSMRQRSSVAHNDRTRQLHTINAMLAVATNHLSKDVTRSKLVQAYMQFESEYMMDSTRRDEKLAATDARKIRWLVIYGVLQYLESALQVPIEVRDSKTPKYPLCCLGLATSAEANDVQKAIDKTTMTTATPPVQRSSIDDAGDYLGAIEPDCQRDDYFISPSSRPQTAEKGSTVRFPLPGRTFSLRSFKSPSLSARDRTYSLTLKQKPHVVVKVPSYGDRLRNSGRPAIREGIASTFAQYSTVRRSPLDLGRRSASPVHGSVTGSEGCEVGLARERQTDLIKPTLPSITTLDCPVRSDSTSSENSSLWSEQISPASSSSSTCGDKCPSIKASSAEDSGLLGGLVSISDLPAKPLRTKSLTQTLVPQRRVGSLLRRTTRPESLYVNLIGRHPEESPNASLAISMDISEETPSIPLRSPTRPVHYSQTIPLHIAMTPPQQDETPDLPLRSSARTIPAIPTPATVLPSERPSSPVSSFSSLPPSRITTPAPTLLSRAPIPIPPPTKRSRSSDILSAIITPSTQIWEQVRAKTALPSRPKTSHGSSTASSDANGANFATLAFKVPFLRDLKSEMVKGKKDKAVQVEVKEKRFSLAWRK